MSFGEIGKELLEKYVIVRGVDSGVFAGTLKNIEGRAIVLKDVRRIWYWAGAASASELAIRGPQKPEECKFAEEVSTIIIFDVKEILETTEIAEKSIKEVRKWTAQTIHQ